MQYITNAKIWGGWMNKEIKKCFNELCYLEGCQALYEKQDYFNYCEKCENQCRQFKIVKKINDYVLNLQHQLEENDMIIDEILQIIKECKMLMPHEFDWEEQIENIEEILERGKNDN